MFTRAALTRNPRVDFISRRVEEIKDKKARVSTLALSAQTHLSAARKSLLELDQAMIDAFHDELGERQWEEEKGTYERTLNPEEKRLIGDMERVFNRCRDTMDEVVQVYMLHLDETIKKPLTHNTPEEDQRLQIVMSTKEEYKSVRTLYSDAMIDRESEVAADGEAAAATMERVEETKKEYEAMSERLCDDALRYERIYRDELAQRVSAHFMSEQHLLRGMAVSMRDFVPYTKGLTLDWKQMQSTRQAFLAASKTSSFDFDGDDMPDRNSNLPRPDSGSRPSSSSSPHPLDNGDRGAVGNLATDLQRRGSTAATAISNAGKTASKSISEFVTKAAAKSATSRLK